MAKVILARDHVRMFPCPPCRMRLFTGDHAHEVQVERRDAHREARRADDVVHHDGVSLGGRSVVPRAERVDVVHERDVRDARL